MKGIYIFDLDGTLVDSMWVLGGSGSGLSSDKGYQSGKSRVKSCS